MLPDINDLWGSGDEREWELALKRFWLTLAARKGNELVQFIRTLDFEYVRGLGVQEWYAFLLKYFHWQFAGNHLKEKLRDLDRNSFEQLFSVKFSLVAIDQSELSDARECLNLVRSPAFGVWTTQGASGLLALLFKEWFGTADPCILESLWKIESLARKTDDARNPCLCKDKERLARERRGAGHSHSAKKGSSTKHSLQHKQMDSPQRLLDAVYAQPTK